MTSTHPRSLSRLRAGAASALLCLLWTCLAAADTITLRSAVSLDAPRDVTIADVSEIRGEQAASVARLVLINAEELSTQSADRPRGPGRARETIVRLADVRAAIARSGYSASRIALSGSTCSVRVQTEPAAAPASTPQLPPRGRAAPVPVLAADLLSDQRILAAPITRALVDALGCAPDDLRLTFDRRDADWTEQPVAARNVIARPLSTSPDSGAVIIEVRLIEGGREVLVRSVSVKVEILTRVARLLRDLPRRAMVARDDFELTERWVTPGAARSAAAIDPEKLVGQVARTGLAAGTLLTPEVLSPPAVVRRNDSIDVWVYQGNVAVKTRAIAAKDGAIGEIIPARIDRQRTPFMVRLDGERRGVLVAAQEPQEPHERRVSGESHLVGAVTAR